MSQSMSSTTDLWLSTTVVPSSQLLSIMPSMNDSMNDSIERTFDQTIRQEVPVDSNDLRLPLYIRCVATSICVLLLLIGIPGNALVPYVVLKTKDLRNSTNIFLINLSISDILVLIISTPTVLIELHSKPEVWFLGSFVCKFLL